MLNYSNVIENDKSYPGLQMREIKPVMKLIIRGKKRQFLSAVGKSLNLLLPNEANTSSRSDQLTALWLSPDEWMIFSNEILKSDDNNYDVEKLLYKKICKTNLGAVTDVTDQFVLINLKGDKIFDLFETRSPFVTSGIRIGTPAVTTRGMKEAEMLKIAELIDRVLTNTEDDSIINKVKKEVNELSLNFPLYP